MLDFGPVHRKEKTSQELAAGLTREDLARLTEEMCDLQLEAIREDRKSRRLNSSHW